jgi:hypothetical protein
MTLEQFTARGNRRQAQNDEPGDDLTAAEVERLALSLGAVLKHTMTREREGGCGPMATVRVVCSCGWRGPLRFEYQDDLCAGLAADERAHA